MKILEISESVWEIWEEMADGSAIWGEMADGSAIWGEMADERWTLVLTDFRNVQIMFANSVVQ
jgi:hypothetical protein